jgi:hypothetical protein
LDATDIITRRMQGIREKKRVQDAEKGHGDPPETTLPAEVIQLPLWPDPVRGAPNSFLRSALFAAIQGKG